MGVSPLRAPKGATKKRNIVGRGRSSGNGKTSGRGSNGQNSRSGGGVRIGFEGGQMPIYRRVAARGFSNYPFKKEFVAVNVASLEKVFASGETVNLETLVKKGLIKKTETMVKLLGQGELKKKLTVSLAAISVSAREKIEKAGGTVVETAPEVAEQ
jgi:large subunit ribosomal protein L15